MRGCSCGILIGSTQFFAHTHIFPGTKSLSRSAWNEFTFPHQPEENVISSEAKLIWNRINDVPGQLTDTKTSDPLLFASFLSFDTMITDWMAGIHIQTQRSSFPCKKQGRRVDSTLNEHWDIMPHSQSINNLWKWLITSVLTLLTPKAKCWLRQSSPHVRSRTEKQSGAGPTQTRVARWQRVHLVSLIHSAWI